MKGKGEKGRYTHLNADFQEQQGERRKPSQAKKTKIMASGPITSRQTDGETMETVIFLGSKVTVDSDCNHEIKRCLLLGRKAVTNLDSILKSRDITNKGPSSQSYGFSSSHVQM